MVENLVLESIKIYGYNVRYLPRTITNMDYVFNEDRLSTFDEAVEIEVYIKNVDGFAGQGRFMSKFGLEIRDQVTFTIATRRWDQVRTEKLITENGYTYQLENSDNRTAFGSDCIALEEGDMDAYSLPYDRPREGDLIYFPMPSHGKLFEIKYVSHEALFYQFGQLQVYDLECEMFEYSSEELNTGNTIIDSIEDIFGGNILKDSMLNEDGGEMLDEDSGNIIQEEIQIEDSDKTANNNVFRTENDDVVDFSEKSPWAPERDD